MSNIIITFLLMRKHFFFSYNKAIKFTSPGVYTWESDSSWVVTTGSTFNNYVCGIDLASPDKGPITYTSMITGSTQLEEVFKIKL